MLFRATFVAAALAGLASACVQQPTGALGGNPINTPGLGQIVDAGKPFAITWNPTTTGKVSIVLLRGPSENVIPIDCLAESIDNTGSFSWTPSTSLTPDVTHYGLQIIVTGTGQFQYSTQFGISNAGFSTVTTSSKAATGSSSAPASTGTNASPVTQISDGQLQVPTSAISLTHAGSSLSRSSSVTANATVTVSPSITSSSAQLTTTTISTSNKTTVSAPIVTGPSSGVSNNITTLLPSKSMTVPFSLRTTASAAATTPAATTAAATSANATSAASTATSTPLTANPNAASRAFAASGMLGLVGMVAVLLM